MKEIYKNIKDYEGLYKVSNLGNVKSLEREYFIKRNNCYGIKKNKILKPKIDKGYHRVVLMKDGIRKDKSVHRLVMESFIGESILEVNHINGIKHDNRLENLEYCTRKENAIHSVKNGLQKFKKGKEHHLYGKPSNRLKGKKNI